MLNASSSWRCQCCDETLDSLHRLQGHLEEIHGEKPTRFYLPYMSDLLSAFKAVSLLPSEPIGVVGTCGLGYAVVQLAQARGHPIVIINVQAEGMDLARRLSTNSDLVIDFEDSEAPGKIKSWAGQGGLDVLFFCPDNILGIRQSIKALRSDGLILIRLLETLDMFDLYCLTCMLGRMGNFLFTSKFEAEKLIEDFCHLNPEVKV